MTEALKAEAEVRIGKGSSRRAWWLFGLIAALLVAASLAGATYRPVLASVIHPTGRRIDVVAVTYGTKHRYDPRGPLRRLRQAMGLVRGKPEIYDLTTPRTAVIWVRLGPHKGGELWSGLNNARVYDDHGCSLGWADCKPWYSGDASKARYASLALKFLPGGVRSLTLDLPDGMVYGTRVTVDAPETLPPSGTPAPKLPQSVAVDGLTVHLQGVVEDSGGLWKSGGALIEYQPSPSLTGRWSPGWFEAKDSSGNLQRQAAYQRPLDDPAEVPWTGFNTLCWEAPWWTMRIGSAPGPASNVEPDHVWTIRDVPFSKPGRGTVVMRPVDGATVKVSAVRQNDSLMTAPNKHTRLDQIHFTVLGLKGGGRIILDAVNGESVPKRLQIAGVGVYDKLANYCVLDVPPGEKASGTFRLPRKDGARVVDLTFHVYNYRIAEFTFKPERSPS